MTSKRSKIKMGTFRSGSYDVAKYEDSFEQMLHNNPANVSRDVDMESNIPVSLVEPRIVNDEGFDIYAPVKGENMTKRLGSYDVTLPKKGRRCNEIRVEIHSSDCATIYSYPQGRTIRVVLGPLLVGTYPEDRNCVDRYKICLILLTVLLLFLLVGVIFFIASRDTTTARTSQDIGKDFMGLGLDLNAPCLKSMNMTDEYMDTFIRDARSVAPMDSNENEGALFEESKTCAVLTAYENTQLRLQETIPDTGLPHMERGITEFSFVPVADIENMFPLSAAENSDIEIFSDVQRSKKLLPSSQNQTLSTVPEDYSEYLVGCSDLLKTKVALAAYYDVGGHLRSSLDAIDKNLSIEKKCANIAGVNFSVHLKRLFGPEEKIGDGERTVFLQKWLSKHGPAIIFPTLTRTFFDYKSGIYSCTDPSDVVGKVPLLAVGVDKKFDLNTGTMVDVWHFRGFQNSGPKSWSAGSGDIYVDALNTESSCYFIVDDVIVYLQTEKFI